MKGGFVTILIVNPYLMVPGSQANVRKDFGSSHLVKQIVNPREWVMVLYSHFVQLIVINAHPHHTILLLYEQNGAPQGDTLGRIYPFSINSYNCSLSSINSGALMW